MAISCYTLLFRIFIQMRYWRHYFWTRYGQLCWQMSDAIQQMKIKLITHLIENFMNQVSFQELSKVQCSAIFCNAESKALGWKMQRGEWSHVQVFVKDSLHTWKHWRPHHIVLAYRTSYRPRIRKLLTFAIRLHGVRWHAIKKRTEWVMPHELNFDSNGSGIRTKRP